MNADGVDEACKSNDMVATPYSGARVSNTWIICLLLGDNGWKRPLMPDEIMQDNLHVSKVGIFGPTVKRVVHGISACW